MDSAPWKPAWKRAREVEAKIGQEKRSPQQRKRGAPVDPRTATGRPRSDRVASKFLAFAKEVKGSLAKREINKARKALLCLGWEDTHIALSSAHPYKPHYQERRPDLTLGSAMQPCAILELKPVGTSLMSLTGTSYITVQAQARVLLRVE